MLLSYGPKNCSVTSVYPQHGIDYHGLPWWLGFSNTPAPMGDYYRHFLTSMSGVEGYTHSSHSDELMSTAGSQISMPMHGGSLPLGYQNYQTYGCLGGFSGPSLLNGPKQSRGRRKTGAGGGSGTDHVKHRRTRSGCFMCRSRRVKVCVQT